MLEIAGENAGLLEPMEGNRDLNIGGLFIQARPRRSMAARTRSSATSWPRTCSACPAELGNPGRFN
jgi:hypothetical protein